MNETMMIQIKASVDEALKKLEDVKKELKGVGDQSKKSSKSMSDSMKAATRSAQLQVEAIKQVVASLINLAKSSLEAQKNISKLNSAFLSSGSTTKQAGETYKNLFRFMGDSGAATEAAQQLALITTNEKDLAQWTKILQGVYATMGSTLPVESLAEAANETINVGKVTGTMADALNWAKVSEDEFNAALAKTNTLAEREALVRGTLNSLYINASSIYERNNQALLANAESQAKLDMALAEAGKALLPLMTAVNNLSTTLLTTLRPAFEIVANVIATFISYIIVAIQWVTAFFSLFLGGGNKAKDTSKDIANNVNAAGKSAKVATSGIGSLGGALNKAANAAKELKKQTMGFDELNVVSSQTDTSGGAAAGGGAAGGGVGGITLPDLSEFTNFEMPELENFQEKIDKAKEALVAILVLLGSIGLAFAIFNLPDIAKAIKGFDLLCSKLRFVLGDVMAVAGGIMLVIGYSDAWVNGIDWGNFALIMTGVALLIGGIGLSFGGIIAAITGVGVAIALLVLGLKDFWTNGASVQNILMILIGILGIFAATWYAATLPIALVVTAIAAVIAIIVICIKHWDDIKAAAGKAWDWIKDKWEKVANWFNEKVIQPIVKFFKNLWTSITDTFGKVKEWFSEKFQQAWDGIKTAWNGAGEWFSGIWKKITDTFGKVKDWFKEKFQAAWQAIKDVFSNFGSYFSGLWETIKNTFSSLGTKIGDAIGGAVKAGINKVISWIETTINKAIGLINGAIGVINAIPGVSISKLNKLTLPRLAKGGVVDTATIAMIGEAGKEAVVPLENNTGWMDALADRLAARSANPTKIILKVGEKELGWATINAINGITEQTGGLQLAL